MSNIYLITGATSAPGLALMGRLLPALFPAAYALLPIVTPHSRPMQAEVAGYSPVPVYKWKKDRYT